RKSKGGGRGGCVGGGGGRREGRSAMRDRAEGWDGLHNLRSRSRRSKAGAPSSFPARRPKPDGRSAMRDRAERGTIREAAKILGLKVRTIQTMSQRGQIPSAAKIGRQWTYDLARPRTFVGEQERATTC